MKKSGKEKSLWQDIRSACETMVFVEVSCVVDFGNLKIQ